MLNLSDSEMIPNLQTLASQSPNGNNRIQANPNPNQIVKRKRQQRQQHMLEKLDQETQNKFNHCYSLCMEKQEHQKTVAEVKNAIDLKLGELADIHRDYDIVLPEGKGKFRFNPAISTSSLPSVPSTVSYRVINEAMQQFLIAKKVFASDPHQKKMVKMLTNEFLFSLKQMASQPTTNRKMRKSTKVPKNTFSFQPPKKRKKTGPETSQTPSWIKV